MHSLHTGQIGLQVGVIFTCGSTGIKSQHFDINTCYFQFAAVKACHRL
jgi:hypothetical protein